MIAIIDYGMGNIHSVRKALEFMGGKTLVTNKPKDIRAADKLVLPGVGAFDDAMSELKKRGLIPALKEGVRQQKPFLGICLGMQLLFASSEEAGRSRGLGLIAGEVKKFSPRRGFKVPHMGWNRLDIRRKNCPLLKSLRGNPWVYFCHSYYPKPAEDEVVAASTDYGVDFASLVWKDNLYGVQFHPEKSQETGLKIIRNFVRLPC